MNLSKRLSAVASMVTKGKIMADVGTDHGYVPIYLVKSGTCEKAYAMDINRGPLERAREHIESEGLSEKIEIIRSDGMSQLVGKQVDSVVIAGMGGELTCKILQDSPVLPQLDEIILSPHSDVEKVRRTVIKLGFYISDEMMVEDYGKFYNVIKAVKGREEKEYTDFEYVYGRLLFEKKDEVFGEYLSKLRNKYENIIKLLDENEAGISRKNYEFREKLKQCERAERRLKGVYGKG